jgi:predicted metal-dependent HD superfamily phosphohydrolase
MSLSDRWPLETGHDLRDELLASYADPARHYHDTLHLTEVLDRLDELAAAGERFPRLPVVLAAWFHDGVYDGRPGAEERSARWAETALPGVGVEAGTVSEVGRLVRMTEHHRPADDDPGGRALSDADLAILAAGPARYATYTAAVRAEYAAVPEAEFRAGRAVILRDLLAKEHLFHTAHGRSAWEERARANVAAELAGTPSA